MAAFEEKYDFIGEFHQGVAIVVKNGYYGAIITGGREIIAPSYDYIASFKDGYAQAIRKGECRILDLSGKECKYYEGRWISIPAKYDSVREFKNGYACVMLNRKWGIIDTDGNEKVEPQFYYISDIISGTAKYKKDYGKDWGFLNVDGYYSECIYSEPQIEPNGDVTVFKNHVKVRINKSGQILVKDGNSIVALSKDFVAAKDFVNGASFVQDSNGFWGAVNNKGKTIIPNEYLEIQEFSENKAFAVNKSEKLCLISSDGSVIKVFENYTNADPFKNGYAIVHEGYYKSGLISSNGSDVLKPLEGVIEYTQKKGVFDINHYGETGLFDASLGLLLLPRYRRIIEVLKDYVRVKVNNTIGEGLVDFSGRAFLDGEPRVILPNWCLGARLLIDDIYLGVSSDGKYGLVSSSGETLCHPSFDKISEVNDSFIVTETHKGKYGLYNRKNKVSIPTVFDSIPEVLEHFVKVSIKGLLGVIDFEGNEIIKAEWEDLVFENGCFVVGKTVNIKSMYDDKRFGLFNKNGDLIFDTEFQEIIVLREGLYKIRENSLWALYNDDGQLSNDEFEKMFSLKDGFIGVIKNGVEGRIDLNGNKIVFSEDGASLVLPKEYSFVTDFKDGIAKVQIEGYENYVDKLFNIIIYNEGTIVSLETKVDYVVNGDANDKYYIYVYEGLYGLLSKDGKEIIRAQYGFLSFLSTDLLKAAKPSNNNKSPLLYGIIDIHENEVLGFEYSFIKDDRNKKRKDVFRFDVESQYSDSQSHIKLFEEGKYWVIGQNGSLGLINKDGSVCLKPEYDFIREFEHGFFVMKEKWINGERGIEKCEKWGVIDEAYNTICDSKYDTITQTENGFYKVSIEEAFGILDPYGQVKLEPKYSFIGDVSDSEVARGRALIRQGNLYGIIDEKYNVLVEPQYEYISDFKNGKANVGKRIKGASGVEFVCGVIDVDGLFTDISELNKSEKLDFINPEINSCVKKVTTLRNGYIVVQIDYPSTYSHYCAVFDNDYHIVLPFKCHYIKELDNGMYVVDDGNASGLLDKDFNEIVVLAYSSFSPLQNVLRVSKRENAHSSDDVKYGLMNYQGEIILPLAYSFIESAAPGLVWIYKNGQELVGLSTLEGNVLIEPKYGKVEPFSNNLAKVNCGRWYDDNENHIYSRSRKYSEGLWGIINIEGIEVVLPLYDRIDVDTEQGFFMVTKSIVSVERGWSSITTKSGRLNQEGRLIIKNPEGKDVLASDRFDWQEDFQGSDSTVYYHGKKGIVNTEQQLLVSIIENGKEERIVLPSEYDWGYDSMYSYILVEKDSKKGVINKEGIMIVDCIYDKIEIVSEENEIIFLCALNKTEEHQRYQPLYEWFVFSKSGKKLWPSYFEEVKVLGNALIALKNDEGKFIVSNFRGQLTSEELFDDVKEFGYSSTNRPTRYGWYQTEEEEKEEVNLRYAIVEVDGRFGVINKEGRLSIQPKYHSLSIQKDNNFIADGALINAHEQRIAIKDGLTVFLPEGYKDEEVLQNGLILVRKGGLYGCVNRIGTIVIPIEYKSLECFGNLFSALLYDDVNKAKKWGVINIMNERIVPFSEKYIKIEIDNNIIKFMQDYCWGAFNLQGEIICEPIFDSIISVTDNLMKVGISRYNENAWKIYERYGIENCYSESLITWGLFDIKGNMILSPEYSEIADKVINELIEIKKDEKIGYADITGRIILEPTYKSISNFIDGYAVVTKKWYDSYGVINSLFKEIIPCVFSNIKYEKETGLFKTDVGYKTADGKYITSVNGKEIYVNNKYNYCKEFHNDCAIAVQAKNNRIFYALINSKSEDVFPPIFEDLKLLDNGLYKFKINYKFGLADSKGNIILPNIYDGIGDFEDNYSCIWIKDSIDNSVSNKLYGIIDFEGNEILPPLYEIIGNRSGKFVTNMKKNIWGLFNFETKELTEITEAAYLGPCRDGLCSINIGGFFDKKDRKVKDGLWGYINTDGQVAIEPLYERAFSFSEGFAAVKLEGKWGFIDKNGLSIIPCEYDEVGSKFMNGKAELIKGEYVYVFDKDGKQIDSCRQEDDDYDDDTPDYSDEELKRMTWEAMTDGQYGDYPGGDVDYDTLGFGI